MTNEALESQDESRLSRRNALRAAVGVGVGAVAWSGPQITSFGATPAYAVGCTFAVEFFLERDRNTDQSNECQPGFGFHVFNLNHTNETPKGPLPPDFNISPNVPSPRRCNFTRYPMVMTFPSNLECNVSIRVHGSGPTAFESGPWFYNSDDADDGTGDAGGDAPFIGTSPLKFYLPSDADVVAYPGGSTDGGRETSDARYSIRVRCQTIGAPDSCFSANT